MFENTWQFHCDAQLCQFIPMACYSHICVPLGKANKPLSKLTKHLLHNALNGYVRPRCPDANKCLMIQDVRMVCIIVILIYKQGVCSVKLIFSKALCTQHSI